jgi:ankyrin repeat protein
VQYLLQRGATVSVQNDFDLTPLHFAAFRGYPPIVRKLARHGADPRLTNEYGETYLDEARMRGPAVRAAFEEGIRLAVENGEGIRLALENGEGMRIAVENADRAISASEEGMRYSGGRRTKTNDAANLFNYTLQPCPDQWTKIRTKSEGDLVHMIERPVRQLYTGTLFCGLLRWRL